MGAQRQPFRERALREDIILDKLPGELRPDFDLALAGPAAIPADQRGADHVAHGFDRQAMARDENVIAVGIDAGAFLKARFHLGDRDRMQPLLKLDGARDRKPETISAVGKDDFDVCLHDYAAV